MDSRIVGTGNGLRVLGYPEIVTIKLQMVGMLKKVDACRQRLTVQSGRMVPAVGQQQSRQSGAGRPDRLHQRAGDVPSSFGWLQRLIRLVKCNGSGQRPGAGRRLAPLPPQTDAGRLFAAPFSHRCDRWINGTMFIGLVKIRHEPVLLYT
jgi:hypothetical protein